MAKRLPWDKWTNGELHVVQRGVDYAARTPNFLSELRWWARTHDLTVKATAQDENTVAFQFKAAEPIAQEA